MATDYHHLMAIIYAEEPQQKNEEKVMNMGDFIASLNG